MLHSSKDAVLCNSVAGQHGRMDLQQLPLHMLGAALKQGNALTVPSC
jgi:hypothetical protein